jgi:uncharacterized protein
MAQRTDVFSLGRMGLTSGEGRRLELHTVLAPLDLAGERYTADPELVPVRLDISRTTGSGYALRLRFSATLTGPCMRCLGPAAPSFDIDAREVDQPGAGDEDMRSPYVDGDEDLDLSAWARDAFALAVPTQITCTPECRGLCPHCGANLNEEPDHAHEAEPDPRWSKLSEIRFE